MKLRNFKKKKKEAMLEASPGHLPRPETKKCQLPYGDSNSWLQQQLAIASAAAAAAAAELSTDKGNGGRQEGPCPEGHSPEVWDSSKNSEGSEYSSTISTCSEDIWKKA